VGIRLLICDDQEITRIGIDTFCQGSDVEIVGSFASGVQALANIERLSPNVIVQSLHTADISGSKTIEQICDTWPTLPVLVLSSYESPLLTTQIEEIGAFGLIRKDASQEEFLQTIRDAANMPIRKSRDGQLRKVARRRRRSRATLGMDKPSRTFILAQLQCALTDDVPLTPREVEILQQIVEGAGNQSIAKKFEISVETVKEHIQHMLRKLAITDRTQAAIWAIRLLESTKT